MNVLALGLAIVFAVMAVYTTVTIAGITAPSDSKIEMMSKIRTVTGVNVAMTFVLALLSFLMMRSDPASFQNYSIVMLHINLALSLIAVSVASIQKIAV
jgi:hypothetical protein